MATVRRCPEISYAAASTCDYWIDLKHVAMKMFGARMIDFVHGDCSGIMIHRQIDGLAKGLLHSLRCAAATGKQVNVQLIVRRRLQGQRKLRGRTLRPSH